MKLLKRLEKAKKGTTFLIFGSTFLIFFFCLLGVQHLNQIKVKNSFKTFTKESDYKVILSVAKKRSRTKLFDDGNYHFYGIGIQNIEISYQGVSKSLKSILKNKDLSFTDFLENWHLVYTAPDQTVQIYESDTYELIIENILEDEKEITIKKVN